MLSRWATFDDDPVMDILNDCFCALFSSSARLQKAPFTGRQLAGGHAGYRQYLEGTWLHVRRRFHAPRSSPDLE